MLSPFWGLGRLPVAGDGGLVYPRGGFLFFDGGLGLVSARTGATLEGGEGVFLAMKRYGEYRKTYHSLQGADLQAVQDLSCFVGMADVFEGLGRVLAAYIQENLFAASATG